MFPGWLVAMCVFISSPRSMQALTNRQTRDDEAVIDAVWDGLDAEEEADSLRTIRGKAANGRPAEPVHLLGPPASGNNLIIKMFQTNWPGIFSSELESVVWKHSLDDPPAIRDLYAKTLDLQNTTIIIAVRSPISQFASWEQESFSLAPCFRRPRKEWTHECFANSKHKWHDLTPGVDINTRYDESIVFPSSMAVYNQYMKLYLDLQALGGFKNVIIAPYEDTVLAPEAVFEELAGKIGLQVPEGGIRVYGHNARSWQAGNGHGRQRALNKLKDRPWLATFGGQFLSTICQELDRETIQKFSFGRLSGASRSYLEDCA